VVAERLGYARDEALIAGACGRGNERAGEAVPARIREASDAKESRSGPLRKAPAFVELLGRSVPVVKTTKALRSVSKRASPDAPEAVER
jgi:hypothetical protein